jgi:hypothetical protein
MVFGKGFTCFLHKKETILSKNTSSSNLKLQSGFILTTKPSKINPPIAIKQFVGLSPRDSKIQTFPI